MSDQAFGDAPSMGDDFSAHGDASYDAPLEHDAQEWEPMEEPSEKHYEMHLTPGGTLEQEVHSELDAAARERIIEAQRKRGESRPSPDEKELDFAGDFDDARRNAWGWDPESEREYEESLERLNKEYENDPFETGRRFEREMEPERLDEGHNR